MSATVPLSSLREILAQRFPQSARPVSGKLCTGLPAIDDLTGGLPRHALTELVCTAPSAGSHLFLAQLLAVTRALPARAALIDAADQFDPQSIPPDQLEHLLWVRCRTIHEAIPVADILARDANFDLLVLDVVASPLTALRRIPASTWYRLQRAVEQTDLAFLVLTSLGLVPSAQLRLQLEIPHRLLGQAQSRPSLALALAPVLQRQRLATLAQA